MAQVRYTRNLFLRGVCIIYLFAFLSFYIQIPGLYGDNGILPARTQLDLKSRTPLLHKLKQKPTLLWFAPYLGLNAEYMLDILSLCGVALSFAGFISQRFCTSLVFALLWSLYFSLYQIGQIFMWFQWDALLLEAGFLCILVAPFWYSKRAKLNNKPSDAVTFWTVRWLLFRLMFSSGVVKLTSGCPIWWKLDALNVHFESQCIPTPLAWYAHHLPAWFLRCTTVLVNIFELVIPFLFFFPNRKVRITAFYTQMFLQIHIIATGNYNFFNFLTICLCISLLDDQFFYKKKSKHDSNSIVKYLSTILCVSVYAGILYGTYVYYNLKITENWTIQSNIAFTQEQFDYVLSRAIPISIYIGVASLGFTIADAVVNSLITTKGARNKIITTLVTCLYTIAVCYIFAISTVPYATLHHSHNSTIPTQLRQIQGKVEYLRLVNSYGLFRRMTGVDGRPEVIIEGSNNVDGPWKEYEFLYKPGNVNNSLPFVAPHQPRLDWQMWFAALGTYHQNPWLMSLAYRLLSGQPEVLALMNNIESPFREKPPQYIKASLYRYHYTPWSQSWNKQAWWTREKVNEYFPIFSHDHPPLIEYLSKMKIIQDKPAFKVTNELLKLLLDSIRSVVSRIEASLLLWGVFTAGCAIVMTSYNNLTFKKN
ncbi:PREDICTED: lipase maturation factor 2-like [Dufourea novaeangliae]|uniref:Lipase maturation factor n=1 Tax=Dufourea novaeangliae TaxID=178035 RepID=A0A154PAV6_DUFNO|nr:PREDICTED: lipase maturation factor 2-like [Dufourea novaeangliae]KZC09035.1 Lipase maturation factor 2 [Dufourea novaeangliae]